ncbi:MAG: KEOPS complex subunit Cgi121 [Candidatus Thermoplasmatota archaeon]|nr:KEOPS complex subunit Cgi121 [Candidatus Thermoplasmatota archaeon]
MQVVIVGCRQVAAVISLLTGLREFGRKQSVALQALHAPHVYGEEHVIAAAEHAVRAFQQGTATCNTLDMEVLLYASGQRQIREAIDLMGIRDGEAAVVAAVGSTDIPGYGGTVDQSALEEFLHRQKLVVDPEVARGGAALAAFGITPAEMAAVDKSMYGDLILEKVALVDVLK